MVSTNAVYSFTVTEDAAYVANFMSTGYHWNVDIYQYTYNMSVIGIIQINGEEQLTPALEIGAFYGDECRGRERLTYFPQVQRYMVFLTIFGENNEEINFRLYDHSMGVELEYPCTNALTFAPNDIVGTAIQPYAFNFLNSVTVDQTTSFSSGWNWYSSYIELSDIEGLEMLEESLGANCEMIASQTSFTNYYEGYGWYGSLDNIVNEQMYRLKMSSPTTVTMTGTIADPADHPITITKGWNHIGFISTSSLSVNDALVNMAATAGEIVKSQSTFANYYDGFGWYGSLSTINPGMGLMYKSSNDNPVTFTYPSSAKGELRANLTAENNHWVPDMYAYPTNMTMMAVVELNDVEVSTENYELAAFANNECRGSVRLLYVEPIDRYVAFLTIAGDEESTVTFRLYNTANDTEYTDSDFNITYHADAMLGGFNNPVVIDFNADVSDDVVLYPNPVKAGERVNVMTSDASRVRVEIYNALGAMISDDTTNGVVNAPEKAGVYMVKTIATNGDVKTTRLVVE